MGDFELQFGIGVLDCRKKSLDSRMIPLYYNDSPLFYGRVYSFKVEDKNWASMVKKSVKRKVKSLLNDLISSNSLAGNAKSLVNSADITCKLMLKGINIPFSDELMCRSLDGHIKYFRNCLSGEKEMVFGALLVLK